MNQLTVTLFSFVPHLAHLQYRMSPSVGQAEHHAGRRSRGYRDLGLDSKQHLLLVGIYWMSRRRQPVSLPSLLAHYRVIPRFTFAQIVILAMCYISAFLFFVVVKQKRDETRPDWAVGNDVKIAWKTLIKSLHYQPTDWTKIVMY